MESARDSPKSSGVGYLEEERWEIGRDARVISWEEIRRLFEDQGDAKDQSQEGVPRHEPVEDKEGVRDLDLECVHHHELADAMESLNMMEKAKRDARDMPEGTTAEGEQEEEFHLCR